MSSRADAAPSWVFAPELAEADGELTLSAEESHYVARVCRARIGDALEATDGHGVRARLTVAVLGERVRAHIDARETCVRGATAEVWCGPPEGQRADWLVEKLAELGVAVWQPIDCERAAWRSSAVRPDRWERLTVAALRQSQRLFRMEVRRPIGLNDALAQTPPEAHGYWADPAGAAPAAAPEGHTIGVIGPAQGLSAAEKRALEASGLSAMSLSDGRLRAETAALAWAAWWGQGQLTGGSNPKP